MNSISFDGRLGQDAELRYTPSGDAVLSFSVASDIGYGERKATNWFNCQVWGKRGEALKPYLGKGQQVTVYGQLTLREWQDKEGNKRLSPDVRVNELSLQGGKVEELATSTPPPPPKRATSYAEQSQRASRPQGVLQDMDDDIPF